jgi:hypothetical protein
VVADGHRALGVDGAANRGQYVHPRTAQCRRGLAGQQRLRVYVHSIAKPKSKRRQDTLRYVLENRGERLADAVDLVATVELDVLWRDFPVQSQIACGTGRGHPKSIRQVWAADFAHEVQAKVDVSQPLPLGMVQTLDALEVHGQAPLIHI